MSKAYKSILLSSLLTAVFLILGLYLIQWYEGTQLSLMSWKVLLIFSILFLAQFSGNYFIYYRKLRQKDGQINL